MFALQQLCAKISNSLENITFYIYIYMYIFIGDAHDIVNIELATAGDGEVVGHMCNRSRYVASQISSTVEYYDSFQCIVFY